MLQFTNLEYKTVTQWNVHGFETKKALLPQIIHAGIDLLISLIRALPQIIAGIVSAFGSLMYKIVEIGGNIVKGLWFDIQQLAS